MGTCVIPPPNWAGGVFWGNSWLLESFLTLTCSGAGRGSSPLGDTTQLSAPHPSPAHASSQAHVETESAPEERSTPAAPFPKENSSRPKRWDHPGQKEERGLSAEPSRGARGARAGRGCLRAPLGPCRCQHGEVFSGLSG